MLNAQLETQELLGVAVLHDEGNVFSKNSNFKSWKVNSVTRNKIEIELDFFDKLAIKSGDYAVAVVKFMEFTDN